MINHSIRRMMPHVLTGLLACAPAMAETAAPAVAQTVAPDATQTEGQPGSAKSAMPAAAVPARGHPVVERRIADLRGHLKITAAEQPAFNAFANVMRTNAKRMDDMLHTRRSDLANASAVEQMRSYQALAEAHVADMQRLVPAFERLYEALTPAQKRQADQSFRDFAKSGRA